MAIFGEVKIANAEEYNIGGNRSGSADRMHISALGSTAHDASNMHRMGKQQLLLVECLTESLCAGTLLIAQSEKFPPGIHHRVCGGPSVNMGKCSVVSLFSRDHALLLTFGRAACYGLFNGGTAGVIWMMIMTWIFFLAKIASFAPSSPKPLSYIVGTLWDELHHYTPRATSKSRMVCSFRLGWWYSRMCANAFESHHRHGPPRISRREDWRAVAYYASDDALAIPHGWFQCLPGTASAPRRRDRACLTCFASSPS